MSSDSPIKADIEVKDETVRAVVDAALDILSAPIEMMAWLGDSVRVHRVRSALRCFSRTKQIAKDAGVTLSAPPVKFLSQYIENCSLENEDDEQVIEWWAQLLVAASTRFGPEHTYFASILKQVSGNELELLECLVRNGRGSYRLMQVEDGEFDADLNGPIDDIVLPASDAYQDWQKAAGEIVHEIETPGILVLDIFIDNKDSQQLQLQHPDYDDADLPSWQILQSLQLVRVSTKRIKDANGNLHCRIRWVVLTELGASFFFSCHDPAIQEALSDDARFTRRQIST